MIERWNRPARDALDFAMGISGQVVALHLARLSGPEQKEPLDLRRRWHASVEAPLQAEGRAPPRLRVAEARYRRLHHPVLDLIGELRREWPEHYIAVVLPERVKQGWLQQLMHAHHTHALLRHLAKACVPRLVLVTLPWSLTPGDRHPC